MIMKRLFPGLLTFVLIMLIALPMYAQKKSNKRVSIEGYLREAGGKPVANAIFLADELQLNARSNRDGYFRFKTLASTEKIMALSLEFGLVEIPFPAQESMMVIFGKDADLTLEEIAQSFPDVDFVYGKIRQSPGGNSQRELDGSKYASIYQLIQVEIPGAQVRGKRIFIQQGQASLDPNANFDPLFIINGVQTQSIENVQPSEVKSVELLKGPDASSYGVQGANGVIIITLK